MKIKQLIDNFDIHRQAICRNITNAIKGLGRIEFHNKEKFYSNYCSIIPLALEYFEEEGYEYATLEYKNADAEEAYKYEVYSDELIEFSLDELWEIIMHLNNEVYNGYIKQ